MDSMMIQPTVSELRVPMFWDGLDDDKVLKELNKAKVRVGDASSFCSLIDVSRKTYHTWQNQFAQPDFVTFLHMLNCSVHDSDREVICSMLENAFCACKPFSQCG